MSSELPTDFAPAERDSLENVLGTAKQLQENPLIEIFNAVPVPLIIINQKRQAVFCNSVFQTASNCKSIQELIGLRPGEALGCIHANAHEGGCGTSRFCKDCGAALAIIKSLQGENATEECRILRKRDFDDGGEEALDLHVFTSPFKYLDQDFILFTAMDISHEKRKQNLEHLFFHDVLNLVTGLKYAAQTICKTTTSDRISRQCQKMTSAITQIAEEIQAQKALSSAEEGSLRVYPQLTTTGYILNHIREIYSGHNLCVGRHITISPHSINYEFKTDPIILSRILGNMIKNALEASEQGAEITIGANTDNGLVQLWVHNECVIPAQVQRQIFKRSFSTKGDGRGIGTYSMKLLAENYLKGLMAFESSDETGTVFSISLPEKGLF
ncbi:sensor histidine kinase [Maridesulfovibrio hydrothermalis]|uniref:Histidine kinase n=1 Tax=Maridesulfovibrio hydrothermalis AM13 = DSM 14728 TaxID=1121451 RepID=L0RBR2_9BACT|nr:HAMP domain-containing sensor histidine kinase [Maridesulfovibrio hydrothermalis]CCO23662.1 Histidine kinase [Maridesulfovibrio hydrothermalis AM13 = DSM 14728]